MSRECGEYKTHDVALNGARIETTTDQIVKYGRKIHIAKSVLELERITHA